MVDKEMEKMKEEILERSLKLEQSVNQNKETDDVRKLFSKNMEFMADIFSNEMRRRMVGTVEKIKSEIKSEITLELGSRKEEMKEMSSKLEREMDSIRNMRNSVGQQINNAEKEANRIKEDIKKQTEEMFENADFMIKFKKTVFRFMRQELDLKFEEKGIQSVIRTGIIKQLKENINEFIINSVDLILNKINEKMNRDLSLTKSVCLSIDNDIKKALRDLPISYQTEQECKIRFEKILTDIRPVKEKLIETGERMVDKIEQEEKAREESK